MPARLIINADDFGLTAGINRAISELHEAGAVTSATLMATGPAFQDAVQVAHRNPALGVGCHVVFVDGAPIAGSSQTRTLLKGNREMRSSFISFAVAVLRGVIQEEQLVVEAIAQVQYLQQAGIQVTHLDTHKHTHMLPMAHRALLTAASACEVAAIRNPFEPRWARSLGHGGITRRASITVLAPCFQTTFRSQQKAFTPQVATTDGTIGVGATGKLDRQTLSELLAAIPASGTWELVVHPGYNDVALASTRTRLRTSRERERQALNEVIAAIQKMENPPALVHYGQLSL